MDRTEFLPLNRSRAELFRRVEDRLSYIDTIRVWIPRHTKKSEYAALKRTCKKIDYIRAQSKLIPRFPSIRKQPYVARLSIQRPTVETVKRLREIFEGESPPVVNAVHIALDLIAGSTDEAKRIGEEIVTHLYLPYHGTRSGFAAYGGDDGTTYYYGEEGGPNTIAIYSDRPSKVAMCPCCHFELRLQGIRALRRHGILSLAELLDFDYREFWRLFFSRKQWMKIDAERLEHRIRSRWPECDIDMGFWLFAIANSLEFDADWRSRGNVTPSIMPLVLWARRARIGQTRGFLLPAKPPNLELSRAHARGLWIRG